MNSLRLYLRALAASAGLAGMVFGVPLALLAVLKNPLPDWDALRVGDLSDDVLLHVVATIAWLLWGYLVLLIILEAAAQVSDRPRLLLPGLGPNNYLQPLVAALLLSTPVAATIGGSVSPPTHPPQPAKPTGSTATDASTHPAQRSLSRVRSTPVAYAAPDPQASSPAAATTSSDARQIFLLGMGAGMGLSLIAATFHVIVRRLRRNAAASRQPGYLPALAPPDIAVTERALESGEQLAAANRDRLNRALARLDLALSTQEQDPLDILAVRLGHERISLVLPGPPDQPLPQPWLEDPDTGYWFVDDPEWQDTNDDDARSFARTSTGERVWSWIGQSVDLSVDALERAPQEDFWLLNLAATNLVRVIAPDPAGTALVRAMVLSLDPGQFGELFLEIDSSAEALIELTAFRPKGSKSPDQFRATLRIVDGLRAARHEPDVGVTVVVLTDDLGSVQPDEVRLVLDATGHLHTSFTDVPLVAARFAASDLENLRPVLQAATAPATRIPPPLPRPSSPSGPQRPAMNVIGLPIIAASSNVSEAERPLVKDGNSEARGGAHSVDRKGGFSVRGERSARDAPSRPGLYNANVPGLATRLGDTQRGAYQDDPELDSDLQLLGDPNCPRPRLRILGSIRVEATGPVPADGKRSAWWSELVVLLYAHPAGLTYEQFIELLWPRDTAVKAASGTPRQSLSNIRKWLGTDPLTGQPYLPEARSPGSNRGIYRIDGMISDADLARRLRTRGVSRGPEGLDDLQQALDLVTGPILDGRRQRGYGWLVENPILTDLTTTVTDIAHTLATQFLARGLPERAEAVARKADLAGGYDDITRLDLIAAARAQGNLAGEEYWLHRLIDTHGGEVEEDLRSWTLAQLDRMRRLNRHSAS